MQVQNKVIGVLAKSLLLLLNKSRRVYEGDEAMLTKSFIEFLYDNFSYIDGVGDYTCTCYDQNISSGP